MPNARPLFLAIAALTLLSGCRPGAPGTADVAPVDESAAISVVTLNIWHDRDNWPARMDYIVRELRRLDPDVIGLQEVIQRDTLPNQAATIARALGYDFHFTSVDPEDRPQRYGNAILTKHTIVGRHWKPLLPLNDYRTVAHARIAIGSREVDVYDTHLHHTAEGGAIRREQIEDLLGFIRSTRGTGPVIVMGDFNAAPEAQEMQLMDAEYADAYASVHPDAAARARTTLNPELGHTARRIDHIYFERGRFEPVSAEIILDHRDAAGVWASDHFGVIARLRIRPDA